MAKDRTTLSQLLRIGDVVEVNVDKETRSWVGIGENFPPDGKKGVIDGFFQAIYFRDRTSGLPPGEYHSNGAPRVRFEDGTGAYVSPYHLLLPKSRIEKRQTERMLRIDANPDISMTLQESTYIRALPKMKFWEWDVVRLNDTVRRISGFEGVLVIRNIHYHDIDALCNDKKTLMPLYDVEGIEGGTGSMCFRASELDLVRRGNIWLHYHKKPITFASIEEEAILHKAIGQYKEIRNPKHQLYSWSKDEVLEAIEKDMVDGFSMGVIPFTFGNRSISAVRFIDRDLGNRIRQATLKGFGRQA